MAAAQVFTGGSQMSAPRCLEARQCKIASLRQRSTPRCARRVLGLPGMVIAVESLQCAAPSRRAWYRFFCVSIPAPFVFAPVADHCNVPLYKLKKFTRLDEIPGFKPFREHGQGVLE
jgi:hypothetical protein